MQWLMDEAIEEFLESSIVRVEFTRIHRDGSSGAYVVLKDGKYIGTVTRTGRNRWDVFTRDDPDGTRVSTFDTAIQLVELTDDATWKETSSGSVLVDRVERPVEES